MACMVKTILYIQHTKDFNEITNTLAFLPRVVGFRNDLHGGSYKDK